MAEFELYSFEPMRDFSDSDGENTAHGQNKLARGGGGGGGGGKYLLV